MPEKIVHDHWFAVVTAVYGTIYYLPEPLIQYRLHAANQIGSQAFDFRYVAKKLINLRVTLMYDLRLMGGLPKVKRPILLEYGMVKLISNLRRLF
jgi:hypothetical protein